ASIEQFRPLRVHRHQRDLPLVFDCRPFRGEPLSLFAIASDPWTGVRRFVGVSCDEAALPHWLERRDAGVAAFDFLPPGAHWQVFELAGDGTPLSAWSAPRADALRPLPVE